MQNTNSQKLHVCFSVESYYQNGKQQNILQFTRSVIGAIFKLVSLRQIFDQTWHGKYFPANEWMYNVAFHTLKEPGSFTVVRNREILGPRRRKSYELFYSSVAKKWRLLISIHLILSAKEMNPIIRKNMLKLVIQTSFIDVDQTHAEWQTFETPKIRDKCMTVTFGQGLTVIRTRILFSSLQMSAIRVFLANSFET